MECWCYRVLQILNQAGENILMPLPELRKIICMEELCHKVLSYVTL